MKKAETIEDFYKRAPHTNPLSLSLNNAGLGHINILSRECCNKITDYNRRDFYKVSLIIGKGKLHYADKWIIIDKPALIFSNPLIPYSWETTTKKQAGWFCLFTESFLQNGERIRLQDSPLFKIGGNHIFFLDKKTLKSLNDLFLKMHTELASEYIYKYDVLRNYLHLLTHEAMKLSPPEEFQKESNASTRITNLFLELLERQFPIDSTESALKLKTANDYAYNLSVHVNHLNRSIKEVTGKTTSNHIAARVIQEAKALLQHSNWNISEIAYGLGFEYPQYFTNFFRKQTGKSPAMLRATTV